MKFFAPSITSEQLYVQDKRRRDWDAKERLLAELGENRRKALKVMRPPKSLTLAIMRDVAFDISLQRRFGLTREEIQTIDRWAHAMPEWSLEARIRIELDQGE